MSTLLMVEDNETLIRFSALNIKAAIPGIDVVTASSCDEAQSAAANCHPEVIVIDYRLPDGDGLALQQQIRNTFPIAQTIMISAHWSADLRHEAEQQNAFKVLDKPFEADVLIQAVAEAFTIHEALASESWPPESPQESPASNRHGEHAELRYSRAAIDTIKRVLIIDEVCKYSALERIVMAAYNSCATDIVSNGIEALDRLEDGEEYDLAVLNVDISGMDTMPFIKTLKRAAKNELPVIAVNSESNEAKLIRAVEFGASGYVAKPWKPDLFREVTLRAISSNQLAGATRTLMQMSSDLAATINKYQQDS